VSASGFRAANLSAQQAAQLYNYFRQMRLCVTPRFDEFAELLLAELKQDRG
jgi:hypothetical protein